MSDAPNVQAPVDEKRKSNKMRSPAYPAINLETALKRAQVVYDAEKRNGVPFRALVSHWGFKEKSSGGFVTVAALKAFSLMKDGDGSGPNRTLFLTDLALRILLDKRPDSEERAEAIKRAAMMPKIHQELWNKFGLELGSDASLRHRLIFDWKFNENVVDYFIRDYRDTLAFAKFTTSDTVIDSGQEEEQPAEEVEEEMETPAMEERTPARVAGSTGSGAARQQQPPVQAGEISTPVGKDDGKVVFARVRFDGELRKEYVTSLKKYLEYLESTL